MKVLHTNANQFFNKREDLLMFLQGNNPDIIMITEMIPKQQKNKIPLAMLHGEGYEMYFNFNPEEENLGTTGIRGTAIYVRNGLCFVETKIEHSNHKDQVWIDITLNKQDKLLCGCIYI